MSNGLNDLPAGRAEPAANPPGFGELAVEAIASFRGQPGEGQSGYVRPGDVLVLDRRRAAELRANGLVRAASVDAGDVADAARTILPRANRDAIALPSKPKGKAP